MAKEKIKDAALGYDDKVFNDTLVELRESYQSLKEQQNRLEREVAFSVDAYKTNEEILNSAMKVSSDYRERLFFVNEQIEAISGKDPSIIINQKSHNDAFQLLDESGNTMLGEEQLNEINKNAKSEYKRVKSVVANAEKVKRAVSFNPATISDANEIWEIKSNLEVLNLMGGVDDDLTEFKEAKEKISSIYDGYTQAVVDSIANEDLLQPKNSPEYERSFVVNNNVKSLSVQVAARQMIDEKILRRVDAYVFEEEEGVLYNIDKKNNTKQEVLRIDSIAAMDAITDKEGNLYTGKALENSMRSIAKSILGDEIHRKLKIDQNVAEMAVNSEGQIYTIEGRKLLDKKELEQVGIDAKTIESQIYENVETYIREVAETVEGLQFDPENNSLYYEYEDEITKETKKQIVKTVEDFNIETTSEDKPLSPEAIKEKLKTETQKEFLIEKEKFKEFQKEKEKVKQKEKEKKEQDKEREGKEEQDKEREGKEEQDKEREGKGRKEGQAQKQKTSVKDLPKSYAVEPFQKRGAENVVSGFGKFLTYDMMVDAAYRIKMIGNSPKEIKAREKQVKKALKEREKAGKKAVKDSLKNERKIEREEGKETARQEDLYGKNTNAFDEIFKQVEKDISGKEPEKLKEKITDKFKDKITEKFKDKTTDEFIMEDNSKEHESDTNEQTVNKEENISSYEDYLNNKGEKEDVKEENVEENTIEEDAMEGDAFEQDTLEQDALEQDASNPSTVNDSDGMEM